VTDTTEAPIWQAADPELGVLGPFTRDRKAYLVRADRPELAGELDAWLLDHEADGSLQALRDEWLGKGHAPMTVLDALVAAMDERLGVMPWVEAAKRARSMPIASPKRERVVMAAALSGIRKAEERAGRDPWPERGIRLFFSAQIDAAKQVQLAAGRDADFDPKEPLPHLDRALRPALLRIGDRITWLLTELPDDVDPLLARAKVRRGLRTRYLSPTSIDRIANTLSNLIEAGRVPSADEEADEPTGDDGQEEAGAVTHQGEAPAQDRDLPGDEPVDGQQGPAGEEGHDRPDGGPGADHHGGDGHGHEGAGGRDDAGPGGDQQAP
jgi:chorismate mutase